MTGAVQGRGHVVVARYGAEAVTVSQMTVRLSAPRPKSDESGEDRFDPESVCDAREKAMIARLRSMLRPAVAPECLIERIEATLDRCCVESGRELGGTAGTAV